MWDVVARPNLGADTVGRVLSCIETEVGTMEADLTGPAGEVPDLEGSALAVFGAVLPESSA